VRGGIGCRERDSIRSEGRAVIARIGRVYPKYPAEGLQTYAMGDITSNHHPPSSSIANGNEKRLYESGVK
jgi:hypothetical protein